jgi:hypothetical protein
MLRNRAILTLSRFRFQLRIFLRTVSAPIPVPYIILRVILRLKYLSLRFLLKLYGKRLIFNFNCLFGSPSLVPFKSNLSKSYLRPFYSRKRSRNRNHSQNLNLEQDHGSVSDCDRAKIIRFRLRLHNTELSSAQEIKWSWKGPPILFSWWAVPGAIG